MKPDEHKLRQQTSLGEGIKMSIAEDAAVHLMDVLIKQYADPLLAVIREPSTNAWDAHIEAKQDKPIRVYLPTHTNQNLTIEDFGIGMDIEDIRETYSQFGASTKRGSNDAVGMLGIGCKSALAYGNQFTVVGTKDGTTTTILVSRDEDGGASMTSVDERTTSLPNGVTITIPIRPTDLEDCHEKAMRLFRFWPKGSVLVGYQDEDIGQPRWIGRGPEGEDVDGNEIHNIWLDERTLLTTDPDVDESIVVMGCVPYPLTEGATTLFECGRHSRYDYARGRYNATWNAVVFVPIGSVNFAPSREVLMDTKRTRATLDQARAHIKTELEQNIRDQIANAKDSKEAQDKLRNGMSMGIELKDAQWNGRTVLLRLSRAKKEKDSSGNLVPVPCSPDDLTVEDALKYTYLQVNTTGYTRKSGERTTTFDLGNTDWHIIVGFDGKLMTNVKRAKLELYMTAKGHKYLPKMVALHQMSADEKFWLQGYTTWKWDDIAAIELPKQTTADGSTVRLKGSYDCIVDGTYSDGLPAAKILEYQQAGKPVYWTHGNYYSAKGHSVFRDGTIDPNGCVVVALSANRIDKFCRDFPAAVKLNDAAADAGKKWLAALDPEKVKAYSIQQHSDVDVLKLLDPLLLSDPDLRKVWEYAKMDTSVITQGLKKYQRWVTFETKDCTWANKVLEKYPLYGALTRYGVNGPKHKDHLVIYLNSAHSAQKGA